MMLPPRWREPFTLFPFHRVGIAYNAPRDRATRLNVISPLSVTLALLESRPSRLLGGGLFFLFFAWGKNRGGAMDKRRPDPQQPQ